MQPDNKNYLAVYPNPTYSTGNIGVRSPDNSPFVLKVFDTKGKVILEKNSQGQQNFSIPLQEEPAGKYQVILKINQTVISTTLLKINR